MDVITTEMSLAESHPWPDSWDITRFAIYKATKGKSITLLESYMDKLFRDKYEID